MTDARRTGRLFLSPHLDDAVFSCGELIASSQAPVVATLFAGRPPADAPHTRWDATCGFRPGDDVVGARRAEDRDALALLDAEPVWLELCDAQYRCSPAPPQIADALADVLLRHAPAAVFVPLGLFHADHERASDAALDLASRFTGVRWFAYADAIYRRIPFIVRRRIAALRRRGFIAQRQRFDVDPSAHARKRASIACYRSQLEGLRRRPAQRDIEAAESYWQLVADGLSATARSN